MMDKAGKALEDAIENLDADETLDQDAPLDDDQEDDQIDGDDQGDEDSTDSEPQDEEFEIALDGDDGSHPQTDENRGIRRRIGKLNAKVKAAETGKTEAEQQLEIERERNRLLQLAVDQGNGSVKKDGPPDPNDFDDGVVDPEYVKAFQAHIAQGVLAEAQRTQQETSQAARADSELHARQVAHYQRADGLKVKDYDDTEDKALEVLGQDVANQIISASDKSAEVLYYLGKNPRVAQDVAELVQTNPVKAVLMIGRLEAKLVARPKAKRNVAPDPDKELTGGGAGQRKGQRGPVGATFE